MNSINLPLTAIITAALATPTFGFSVSESSIQPPQAAMATEGLAPKSGVAKDWRNLAIASDWGDRPTPTPPTAFAPELTSSRLSTSSPSRPLASPPSSLAQADETTQLREQIRLLEERQRTMEQEFQQRQQDLEQQIEVLRQQVNGQTPESTPPAAPVAAAPETRPQSVEPTLSLMFLDPSTNNLTDFALVDPGTALAAGGVLATVNLEQDTALRYGLTYRFANSPVEISVDHLSLSSSGTASAVRPPNGFLFATLAHPNQNERADTASANASIDSNVTNLELGYQLNAGRDFDIRLFTGLRFADLNQEMQVRYDGQDFTNTLITIERGFSGAGLRLGGQANWNIGGGFSLYGRAAGTLLVGDVSINQSEVDNNGLDLIASLERRRETRIIPMLELTAGLDWTVRFSDSAHLTLGAGYTLENWFNAVDNIRFVDASGAGVITQDSADLSWEGFFLRFGFLLNF